MAGDADHELSQDERSEAPRHFLMVKTLTGFEARELNRMEDILAVEEHRQSMEFLARVHGKIKTTFQQEIDATLNSLKSWKLYPCYSHMIFVHICAILF